MKMLVCFVFIFSIFLASAVLSDNLSEKMKGGASEIAEEIRQEQERIRVGMEQRIQERNEEMGQLRERMENESEEIRERVRNEAREMREKIENHSVQTRLKIEEEINESRARLVVQLSNGRNAEVKIMPDVASERALERLRLKVCSLENNCTIELKEVGREREEKRLAYEVKAEKQAKVFGLFRARMRVESQVDAETGEIIFSKKPWWGFLASEKGE